MPTTGRFHLIDEWHWVLHNAWSLRLLVLSAVLSGVEMILPIFMDEPPMPRGVFALMSFAISLAACAARFVAQQKGDVQ